MKAVRYRANGTQRTVRYAERSDWTVFGVNYGVILLMTHWISNRYRQPGRAMSERGRVAGSDGVPGPCERR